MDPRTLARDFQLTRVPADFLDDPYPYYAALLKHAAEFARLRADPTLVPTAVEEMLRYEGSIQLNNRRLLAPMEIGGKHLPAGTFITIGIGAANRDSDQFPDADRFDVGRKPNRHLRSARATTPAPA